MTSDRVTAERITAIAAMQHGVVARPQLLEAGLTPRMVQSRVASGQLCPLHRGVYLLGNLRGRLQPPRAREMAAVLACGPGTVVSHRSAAGLWDLLPSPGPLAPLEIDVTVGATARPRRPGIRARRCVDLDPGETGVVVGIPVTTPVRTLQDLATVVGAQELNRAAARAERRNLVQREELAALVARRHGRRGVEVLRVALGEGGPMLTRSEAEERFLAMVGNGRLPVPETNVVVGGHEVDFLWRAERLVVEVDGFGFHASRHSFENDRRRDAELTGAGLRVVRITWRQIMREPGATLVRLAQALAHCGGPARAFGPPDPAAPLPSGGPRRRMRNAPTTR